MPEQNPATLNTADPVLLLDAAHPTQYPLIGQKAAMLNHLARAGFPVPAGLCITTESFNAAIAPFRQQIQRLCANVDLRDPTVAHNVAQAIDSLLSEIQFPATLRAAVADKLPVISNGEPWIVRSSATHEDLAGVSFAGQYQTLIAVQEAQALEDAILTCWRSYFSSNALAARARYVQQNLERLPADDGAMAVLIQPLLNAECAGVCFTVDPVRLRAELLLVTVAWGLGEGVVAGVAPVDTLRLRRIDAGIEESLIADKHTAIRPDPAGGTQAFPVPEAERRIPCLPEPWRHRLVHLSLAVEQMLGQPQDIEWAIAGQRLWLLQSRPITTLPASIKDATRFPIDWANEAERTRGWWLDRHTSRPSAVMLPAELEFVQINSLGGQAAVAFSGSPKTRWRKTVNGRVYMAVADSPVDPGDRRVRRAAWQDLCNRLHQQGLTMWDHWGPEVIQATNRLGSFDAKAADGNQLAEFLEDTLTAAQRHWMIHTMMPRGGPFEQLLQTYRQISGKAPQLAEEEILLLLSGAETVQTRLIDALYQLAALAQQNPLIQAVLEQKTADRLVCLRAIVGAEQFLTHVEQVLSIYGGRVVDGNGGDAMPVEVGLPWREAPEHLLAMVARYLPLVHKEPNAFPFATPSTARAAARRALQHKVETICAAADPVQAEKFRQHLALAQRSAAFLDEHNHYIDQLSGGQYHQALIDAGRWLTQRGDLPHPYHVFWLHPPEIISALRAPEPQDVAHILAERKQQFEQWQQMLTPAYIGIPDPQLPPRSTTSATLADSEVNRQPALPNTLFGQVASPGKRAGRARIIDESTLLPDLAAGDVLIAVNANPLWTPLFPLFAAIVLDGGSAGDHSAITAREFGVPAVFATGSATTRIPANAWVTVDGESGRVVWA